MRLRVLLFAAARRVADAGSVDVDLPAGAAVADLRSLLGRDHPRLAPLLASSRIAVAGAYAADDDIIREGAEVALIPPVSGGADAAPTTRLAITGDPVDPAAVLDSVRSTRAGGTCLFLGTVRELTGGRATTDLEYEAYESMALASIGEIAGEAARRWPIEASAIVHRVGALGPGEVAVAVAVACPHRAEAFEACRWMIDAIKASTPIWKKERWADGSEEWVHPGTNIDPPTL